MIALAEDGLPKVGIRVAQDRYEELLSLPGCPVSSTGIQRRVALEVLRELSLDEIARLREKWG
jgi:hypothetical protein